MQEKGELVSQTDRQVRKVIRLAARAQHGANGHAALPKDSVGTQ